MDQNLNGGVLLDGGRGIGGRLGAGVGLGRGLGRDGYGWAQVGDYAKYATADSSDDTHVYTVTEYETEEY